jgi:flagellar motor switch protein FliN/FliY
MPDEVVYEQFDQGATSETVRGSEADLRRLSDVPMEASVEIGRTAMTVGDTLNLRPGSIVVLDRMAGEPVDLYVNGTLLASGEVVVVDEQFGLRVNEIVAGDHALVLDRRGRPEDAPVPAPGEGAIAAPPEQGANVFPPGEAGTAAAPVSAGATDGSVADDESGQGL